MMTPRKRRSLGQEAFTSLRRAILRGELEPGARLIEEKTADRFHTSRTPIREAFLRLEQEGLIVRRPRGGFVVGRVSLEDIDEVMDMRAVLEGHAAARAAKRASPELVAGLEGRLAEYEAALKNGQVERLAAANTAFHDHLYAASGSARLVRIIEDLRDYFIGLRPPLLGMEGMARQSQTDHRRILKAIAGGDGVEAERLTREHINRARLAILEQLRVGRMEL